MYTLLIADDEPLECDAIELLVTRANLPVRVIKARNGAEAVEMDKRFGAHIAFLDIRLPGMDGIEAAKFIRAQNPACQIVFLTAWSTFEFAQQAIRLRASEYLVKPVQRKEVYDLLDRLIATLDQQKAQAIAQKEEMREVLNLFSREFFAALKFGRISEEAMQSYFSMQGITLQEGIALVIGGLEEERVQPFFLQGRSWGKLQISYFPSVDRMTVLLFTNQSAKVVEQIAGLDEEYRLVIGTGLPFADLTAIPHSITTASIAYTHAYRQNIHFQRYSEVLRIPKDRAQTQQLATQMIGLTLEGKREKARTIAHELLDYVNLTSEREQDALDELYEFFTLFVYEISKNIPLLPQDKVPRSSVMEQEMYVMDRIDLACEAVERDKQDRYERPFAFIRQYVADHLSMSLTSEDLAALIGINTKYFSQLCKTYLGSPFVEYLTKVRMEKAYALLSDEGCTVREAAEKTGFTDTNYFSRVFRQYHGHSPSSLKESPADKE
ncbi:MAG: response regulator [Sphaerochaeta sp.]|nr:response regulator [Sphaerochaeta sp.]